MNSRKDSSLGYTVVELMVTIVIVTVLATTTGALFVKLLTIQENEREEGYIREKLSDICGAYADAISIGSSFGTRTNLLNRHTMDIKVGYRCETGGVSLETGKVTCVAQIISSMNVTNNTLDLDVYGFDHSELVRRLMRRASGDAALIPLAGNMLSCTIEPLDQEMMLELDGDGFETSNAALGYLEVKAGYRGKSRQGDVVTNIVTAGRVVRLWNRE